MKARLAKLPLIAVCIAGWAALPDTSRPAFAEDRGHGMAGSSAAPAAIAIRDVIPHRRIGAESCFAGSFSGRSIDAEDWAHITHEVVPGVFVAGEPAIRPVPAPLPGRDVSRVIVHLDYNDPEAKTGFNFRFILEVQSKSFQGSLFARAGCGWSGWDGEKETMPETMLACGIECDGGDMTLTRRPGSRDLDLTFHRISMQAGCDGGGVYRLGTSDASQRETFRLERVDLAVCRPLEAWSRRH